MNKKIYLVITIAVLVIAVGAVIFFVYSKAKFSPKNVSFEIVAPKEVDAGEPREFAFICKNRSKFDLEGAKLTIEHTPGVLDAKDNLSLGSSFDFESILAGGEAKKEFKLSLFGKKDDLKEIKAKLEFTPKGYKKNFVVEASSSVLIKSVPLFLKFIMPAVSASGQEIGFSFIYTSKSSYVLPKFTAGIVYPEGFQFFYASPSPTKGNNLWTLGNLKSKGEGEIKISGKIEGVKEENKKFKVELGITIGEEFVPVFDDSGNTKIIETFLSISQFINDKSEYSAYPGEVLNFSIKYKNNTKEKLREVFISSNLKCQRPGSEPFDCLDWKELIVANGEFDGFTKTIFWRASGVVELQELYPGEEGEVKFTIRVKDQLPIKSSADKNFTIDFRSKIDMNPQYIPLSLSGFKISNETVSNIKITSWLTLEAKGYYRHETIKNSGPIPPKVGQVTTYTVVCQISNLSNDLKEVVVEASLPSNVVWKDIFLPKDFDIQYQSFTGKIIWKIGNLAPGVGIISPKKEIAFQVAIQPTKDLIRKSVDLIGDIRAEGIDVFTGTTLQTKKFKITSDIPDDLITYDQGKVVP